LCLYEFTFPVACRLPRIKAYVSTEVARGRHQFSLNFDSYVFCFNLT
jgi:hypothetical protein